MEWEQVPVHVMSRRIKEREIRRKKKKTKRKMKVYFMSCQHLMEIFLFFFLIAETIKVFDGNCSLRRRIFRAITVPRTCNLEQLLTTALRAFHIAREPNVRVNFKFLKTVKNAFFLAILLDGFICN